MRDNWCVGFSDRFTTGVWIGNFDGEPMWNVSGITGAAPVWVDVMNQLHRDLRIVPPAPPAGLVRHEVRLASGQKRPEWFMRGTESDVIRPASSAVPAQIVQPASGTVIAIDPDIPVEQQRVFFECNTGDNTLKWRLDGRALGPAAQVYLWSPKAGKHLLVLVDRESRVQDTGHVRGPRGRHAGGHRGGTGREAGPMNRREWLKGAGAMAAAALEENAVARSTGEAAEGPAAIETRIVRLNLRHTWTTTMSSSEYRDTLQVRYTRDGVTGVGEGAPIVRYHENAESAPDAPSSPVSEYVPAADPWRLETILGEAFRRLKGSTRRRPPSTSRCTTGSARSSGSRSTASSASTPPTRPSRRSRSASTPPRSRGRRCARPRSSRS